MTQNQLRFWELRWKQHYENVYLQETKRTNLAHEAETERHNRREERLETQRLVLERQKLGVEWAKLSESIRAAMVKEVIDYENAKTKRYEAKIKAGELKVKAYEAATQRTKVMNELSLKLTETKTAVAELWLQGVESKTDKQLEAWKHAIDQASGAFTFEGKVNIDADFFLGDNAISINGKTDLGKLMLNIANFGKDMSNSAQFDEVINHIKEIFPEQIEMYGPAAGTNIKVEDLPNLDQHKLKERGVEQIVQRQDPNSSYNASKSHEETMNQLSDHRSVSGPGFSNDGTKIESHSSQEKAAVIGPKRESIGPGFQ